MIHIMHKQKYILGKFIGHAKKRSKGANEGSFKDNADRCLASFNKRI